MTNPFENEDANYFVLINDEGQYSLWPIGIDIPAGWRTVHGPAIRHACIEYTEEHWTDMRPNSLIKMMNGGREPMCRAEPTQE